MKRLTKTYSDGTHAAADNLPCGENSYEYKGLLLETLGKYEDADEQGLLLRLPCKVGDTVYYIEDNEINKFVVYSFDIRPLQQFICNYAGIRLNFNNFGKTVFLTKEEAEQKLKRNKNEQRNNNR